MTILTDDILDNLIESVCHIADLRPSNSWPNHLKALVAHARKVREQFGFEIETKSRTAP